MNPSYIPRYRNERGVERLGMRNGTDIKKNKKEMIFVNRIVIVVDFMDGCSGNLIPNHISYFKDIVFKGGNKIVIIEEDVFLNTRIFSIKVTSFSYLFLTNYYI